MSFSRRTFLGGSAVAVGGLVLADHLRFFQPLSVDAAAAEPTAAGTITGKELVYRTGHSNNCDGACGHLVHVVDGRVTWSGLRLGHQDYRRQSCPHVPPSHLRPRPVPDLQHLQPGPHQVPLQAGRPAGFGQVGTDQLGRGNFDDRREFHPYPGKVRETSVWVAPYTGSLALIEGVVGAGFRFASVIGASAGDSEGDNEGDSATPAGWNYVLVDPANPANGGGFFTGHESVDFLNAKTIVFWANNVAETSLPDWRIMVDARDQNGTQLISIDPRFTVTRPPATSGCRSVPERTPLLSTGSSTTFSPTTCTTPKYIAAYTVGPYLVDPRTKGWLRAKEVIAGAKGKAGEDYVVFDQSDGKVKGASDPSLKSAALLGTHPAGAVQARTALQALVDAVAVFTPEYTAQLTDLPAEQIATWPRCGARASRWPCGSGSGSRTGTTATSTCRAC